MKQKDIAVTFLQLCATGQVDEAFEKYVSPDFRHHNPYFKGDRKSLLLAMKEAATQSPNKIYEVKRVLEDGDLVAVHGRLVLEKDLTEISVVHILKFENNLIVNEWEAATVLPSDLPNENGAF